MPLTGRKNISKGLFPPDSSVHQILAERGCAKLPVESSDDDEAIISAPMSLAEGELRKPSTKLIWTILQQEAGHSGKRHGLQTYQILACNMRL